MEKFNPQKSKDNLDKAIKKRKGKKDNNGDDNDNNKKKSALDIMQDARDPKNKKDPLARKSQQQIRLEDEFGGEEKSNKKKEDSDDYFSQDGIKEWQNEVTDDDEIQGKAMEHLIDSQSGVKEKKEGDEVGVGKEAVAKEGQDFKDMIDEDLGGKPQGRTEFFNKGEDQGEKEHSKSGAEQLSETEAFRFEADKFQEDLVKMIKEKKIYKEKLTVSRKSLSKFDKVKNLLNIKGKEGTAKKEHADKREKYKEMKKNIEQLEEKVKKSYGKYLNKLYEEKGGFDTFDDVVDIKVVDEKTGEKKEEKTNIVDFYNSKLLEAEKAKREALSKKDQKWYGKLWESYKKLPKSKRIAFSVALAGAVGIGAGFGAGFGLGGALAYGSYRALKSTGKVAVSALTTSGVDKFMKNVNKKGEVKDNQKMKEAIEKGFSEKNEDILNSILDYNKKQRNRHIARMSIVGLSGAGLAYSIMSFDSVDKALPNIGSRMDYNAMDGYPDEQTKMDYNAMDDFPMPKDSRMDLNAMDGYPDEQTKMDNNAMDEYPIPKDSKIDPNAMDEYQTPKAGSELNVESRMDLNAMDGFRMVERLGKGDTVWGKLAESGQFGGDKEIAETLNKFRDGVREDLVANQGMTPDQANEYIKWKFHHMQPGDEIFIDKEGNLKIEGFDDNKLVDEFKSSELVGDVEKNVSQTESSVSALEAEVNDPLNETVAKEHAEKMTEQYEQENKDGINTETEEISSAESAEAAEILDSLKEDLNSLDISDNSDVMEAAEEMTVEDLKKALPPGETRISWGAQERSMINNFSEESLEVLNNNTAVEGDLPGISSIRDNAEISYEDYKKLQGIANIVAEGGFDDNMTVADVIKQLK